MLLALQVLLLLQASLVHGAARKPERVSVANQMGRNAETGAVGGDPYYHHEIELAEIDSKDIDRTLKEKLRERAKYYTLLNPYYSETSETAKYVDAYRNWLSTVRYGYENYIRPSFGGNPVNVDISIYIMAFRSVNEVSMDYTVEIYFRQSWIDHRLAFNSTLFGGRTEIDIDANTRHLLWRPDTNLVNAMSSLNPSPSSMSHLEHTRVSNNGRVFQTKRVSVTAECGMNLRLYPFDEQACRLFVSSYGFRNTDILYRWGKNAIEMPSTTQLPDFVVRNYNTRAFNVTYATGEFSTLEFCFVLSRSAGYCVVQLIFPATVLVAASWMSIWLEDDMVFSDVMDVILSILFLSYSYNNVMPKVSYIKGMDLYLGACLLFAFLSLVKMAAVKYLKKRAIKDDERERSLRKRYHCKDVAANIAGMNAIVPAVPIDGVDGIGRQGVRRFSQQFVSQYKDQVNGVGGGYPGNGANGLAPNGVPVDTYVTPNGVTTTAARRNSLLANKAIAMLLQHMQESYVETVHTKAWRRMKLFHYGSQIALPLGFFCFAIFFFFIYPLTQDPVGCDP